MQGQRGTVGSLPESFTFDHGSSSSNTTVDPQICWNNMRNQVETGLPDYVLPGNTNVTYINPAGLERQNFNGWAVGGSSSSSIQQESSQCERKVQRGWPSPVDACAGAGTGTGTGQGPRLEGRFDPTSVLPLDNVIRSPVFMQSANSDMIPQGLNLNEAIVGHGDDDCVVMGCHNLYKPIRPQNERLPPAGGSDHFLLHPASGGFLVEDNDSRAGSSLEGRRVSCKRKAVEANVGQSSASGSGSGSGSYFQHAESSVWPPVPPQCNPGRRISISAPSEQLNSRLGLGVRGISSDSQPDWGIVGNPESSERNFRARINPSNQQDPISSTSFSTSNAVRHPSRSSSHQPRLLPMNHSLQFRPATVMDDTNPQNRLSAIQVPVLPQIEQPFRWNGSSSSRAASSSNSSIPGDTATVSWEEAWSRNIPEHNLEYPMFIPAPAPRSLVRNPTSSNLTGRNNSSTGRVASASRNDSSSVVHPSPAPSWVPDHNPPSRHPRRLSEHARQSFLSFAGHEPVGQSNDQFSLHSGLPPSMQDIAHPSGVGNSVHHQPYPRLSSWAERQGDSVLGFPYAVRALPAGSEGRRRLASEIRNVLDLMRRGEGLRLEDVMILNRSVLLGVADIHDRHRDMRLDVDNMSYEELLALEERIGNVCTGLNEETIQSRLKQRKYFHRGLETEAAGEPCCVCQEEYNDGEDVGTLECGHDFHRDCIKQWLMQKNICPICKTTGLST